MVFMNATNATRTTNHEGTMANEKKTKRDEFSCPCCGTPTDSSYCVPCDAAECGEVDVADESGLCAAALLGNGWAKCAPCVEPYTLKGGAVKTCRIEVWRKADGHYTYGRVLEVLS